MEQNNSEGYLLFYQYRVLNVFLCRDGHLIDSVETSVEVFIQVFYYGDTLSQIKTTLYLLRVLHTQRIS